MIARREFLKVTTGLAVASPQIGRAKAAEAPSTLLNDVQSRLNPTWVTELYQPESFDELLALVRKAEREDKPISISGGRHAMGAQQFAGGALHLDMRDLNRVLSFDRVNGRIEIEAGMQWPELIAYLHANQNDLARPWAIAQKQSGADRLTIGGALASNAHGRGLKFRPIVQDVESFTFIRPSGEVRRCSRTENRDLFTLAIGGYGLFGIVYAVELRLVPRRKLMRVVEIVDAHNLAEAFERRKSEGFTYGDFQYCTDERSPAFLREGVFACYKPLDDETPAPAPRALSSTEWNELYFLAHTDKSRAYQLYRDHYLSTSGSVYDSDTHQLSADFEACRTAIEPRLAEKDSTSLVITEIFVPRDQLAAFLTEARDELRENKADVIYGTIRLIERDDETFLNWAREPYACVIFNLRVTHTAAGIHHAADVFRTLISMAARRGGSYYLTYHKFAKRRQVEACYPQFKEFLRLKRHHDPKERIQSDWYRHYRTMFDEVA
jgi:FAD/FMN-containing dehydrogenase